MIFFLILDKVASSRRSFIMDIKLHIFKIKFLNIYSAQK